MPGKVQIWPASLCDGAAGCSGYYTDVSPKAAVLHAEGRDVFYFEMGHLFDFELLSWAERGTLARIWGVYGHRWKNSEAGATAGREDGLAADFAAAYANCAEGTAWSGLQAGDAPSIRNRGTCAFIRRVGARVPPAHAAGRIPVKATLTTSALRQALAPVAPLSFGRLHPVADTITVNDRVRYQSIVGFGAAMTDTSAWLLDEELGPSQRRAALGSLFGPGSIHVNDVRIPMGASDFTHDGVAYSYDDLPAGETDPTLSHFSIAHDQAYILPVLRQMLRLDPSVRTLAMPWSPPGWMKANDTYSNVDETGVLPVAEFPTYAAYEARFIQEYGRAGVPIDGVTPGNEPHMPTAYPSFVFGGDFGGRDAAVSYIVQNLAPTLRGAGLNVPIYGIDDPGMNSSVLMLQQTSRADLAGIAWHCYAGLAQMSVVHQADPAAEIVMDECSPGIVNYPTSEIAISSLRNWASVVDLWNLALDPQGGPKQATPGCTPCSGLLTVDERTRSYRPNLNYYQLGQVSKYVQRGAVRIASTRDVADYDVDLSPQIAAQQGHPYGVTTGLDNVALLNPDGSKVLVAYNNSSHPIRFQVAWRGRGFVATLAPAATETFTWR